ncbi:hypothetical protein [Streptomyces sp. NRRL B-24484]|uniref:hypothetical protein n=1 Tax=Streptomyces sp. NRRL B-24484 TaxID=1463833 RepID=UPI00133148A6|nr:hypothetical protein [Streptomyces sp. NRRL B-24484]
MSVKQTAEYLNMSVPWVYREAPRPGLVPYRFGCGPDAKLQFRVVLRWLDAVAGVLVVEAEPVGVQEDRPKPVEGVDCVARRFADPGWSIRPLSWEETLVA